MQRKFPILILCLLVALGASVAAGVGIYARGGPGPYNHVSVRGETVRILGQGLYRHMSAEVAIQGIAQDHVTLFLAVPLLLVSLGFALRGQVKARLVLAGTLLYFLLTYLFYLAMATYHELYLVYVMVLSASLFGFLLVLHEFVPAELLAASRSMRVPVMAGWVLIGNAALIAALWLSLLVPPLLDGRIYPPGLEHYTTLIVQGFDLAIFLPLAIISGGLAVRRRGLGVLATTVYMIFLTLLMAALCAKVAFMARLDQPVIPVVFIMPTILAVALLCSILLLGNLREPCTTVAAAAQGQPAKVPPG